MVLVIMKLTLEDSLFRIQLEPMEQLWSFRLSGTIEIPLRDIVRVSTDRPPYDWWQLRIPGTFLPGVIKAGTYYTPRGREFWYARSGKGVLVLDLEGNRYKRVVLTPEDNIGWAERLQAARPV